MIKVSPSNPELPTLIPSAFKVTGKVSSTIKASLSNRKLYIKNTETGEMKNEIQINSETGDWSTFLEPGKYETGVIVNDDEKAKGLQ